jgi:hypothetical protein
MLAALALGCGGAPQQAAGEAAAREKAAPEEKPAAAPAQRPASEEQEAADAQRAWCDYLQALYARASVGTGAWPRYAQCLKARTVAAPKMLRQTAECSHRALQAFQGDPFTVEYAAEVSRCGTQAIEMSEASGADLAPYIAAICGRVTSCEAGVDYAECRRGLEEGLGPHLRRAVGAVNERGREQLRACFSAVTCEDVGGQITACLEPLLDSLLWLPG